MPYIVNDAALKYRESENDQWETAVVHADAEVQAVVQSSEPTGTETLWFDNSNQQDVQVPTWGEFNELKNTLNNKLTPQKQTPTAGTDVTINNGGYYEIGKLVVVNLRLVLSSSIATGSTLISGLPSYVGNACVSMANNLQKDISLQSDGTIKNIGNLDAGTLICSAAYICS